MKKLNNNNVLYKTKTYLIGPMQYKNGEGWRNKVKSHLQKRNIVVFDPYDKPFIKDLEEGDDIRKRLNVLMEKEFYSDVEKIMKPIRAYDLNMVDRSDFVIANIDPTIPTIGSVEELTVAVRMKKATFIAIEGGKKKCPLWLMGMFPHKYIYNTIDDILKVIDEIDDGTKQIDSDRWRLLKTEYR